MDTKKDFLSSIDTLATLPKPEIAVIAHHLKEVTFPAGSVLASQGKTRLEGLYLLRTGALEAFFEEQGRKVLTLMLKPGEVYGGISLLMNSGISIRTVRVLEEATLYLLPVDRFRRLCADHPSFSEQFVKLYARRMADEAYAVQVSESLSLQFLSGLAPFSFLPEAAVEEAAEHLSMVHYPQDTVILHQGRSRVEHLYILQKGAAEFFYEEAGRKMMPVLLGEGEVFGGISLLLNAGKAFRTLRTVEACYFLTLPAAIFLRLCGRHKELSEYFTDSFGERMLDRTYASMISRSLQSGESCIQLFDMPVKHFIAKPPVACDDRTSIQAAAVEMGRGRCSSILVREQTGAWIGLITDHDLRNKVIAKGLDITRSVTEVMSAPLQTISGHALVFEALMAMTQANIKHLAITDGSAQVVGVITHRDLINAQTRSPIFLVREILSADAPEAITDQSSRLARLIQDLMHSGAKAKNITRMITTVSDAILHRIADFVMREMPPPPARFAFMVLGSEGRKEQTLKTDQDNAIVFEDLVDEAEQRRAEEYFRRFGERMCTLLDRAGYAFCKGGIMAKNPRWCQPLSVWKKYFSSWILTASAKDLLDASIFFDLRGGFGDMALVEALRRHLFDTVGGWPGFLRNLTENALHFKPPLGFFRNFVVVSKGENRKVLDLKSAVRPIMDLARIYALRHGVEATNTMDRLEQLHQMKILSEEAYHELDLSYGFLMQLRFSRQVAAILSDEGPPDNFIQPRQLPSVERTLLKEIFKRIETYQTKLSFDFTGAA